MRWLARTLIAIACLAPPGLAFGQTASGADEKLDSEVREALHAGRSVQAIVGDGAAFFYVEVLENFLGGLEHWRLRPMNGLVNDGSLCRADPGREYVVYRQGGGPISLDLADAAGELALEWLDPRTGARQGGKAVPGGARLELACPDERDWALHLKTRETPAASPGAPPALRRMLPSGRWRSWR